MSDTHRIMRKQPRRRRDCSASSMTGNQRPEPDLRTLPELRDPNFACDFRDIICIIISSPKKTP